MAGHLKPNNKTPLPVMGQRSFVVEDGRRRRVQQMPRFPRFRTAAAQTVTGS
ncbi:hypothetical protein ACFSF2_17140 [Paenibacillus rhizophilus]|uniref:hypothetical protein n=1 Tax=Paenibacillus rhizophilus TaxID=1850366 RepID=UPI00362B77F5